jgi:signal transduction histidine kinase
MLRDYAEKNNDKFFFERIDRVSKGTGSGMKGVLEKRFSIHQQLEIQRRQYQSLESQMGRIEPLANLGLISAMIAHEMNNILTPLENYARLSMQHPEDIELNRKTIRKTAVNAERASQILQRMLAMAKGGPREHSWNLLKDLMNEVFICLARDFSKDRIFVVKEIPEELQIWGDPICLQQVFMNLILNAREAMLGKGGTLTIRATELNAQTQIEILDTGCGILPEYENRVFDPFFTTKTSEKYGRTGNGLGLSFCKRIIEEHGGAIYFESKPDSGTTFSVRLPHPN